jgi:phosphate starvation-inducible protein PhoH and related proteins
MKRTQRQPKETRSLKAIDRTRNPKAQQFPAFPPKTENQKYFVESLELDSIAIGAGCAGTGKTILAIHKAAQKLYTGKVKKIVLIRAYQPLAGRSIGFLPGELEEKLLPYYRQMVDYLEDFLGKSFVEIHMKDKSIEICSLETIRGRSWDDTIVVVDEAQNLFPEEIQALVTRIGQGSQMYLIGDDSGIQTDIKNTVEGLSYLLGIVEKYNIPDVGITYFGYDDILRSNITKDFVIAFDKELQEKKGL